MDAKLVSDLLSVADMARDHPNLKPIFEEALTELAKIAKELADEKEKEDAPRYSAGVRPGSQQAAGSTRL
jgi:hypothetical protein